MGTREPLKEVQGFSQERERLCKERLCGRQERAEEWEDPERAQGPMRWPGQ